VTTLVGTTQRRHGAINIATLIQDPREVVGALSPVALVGATIRGLRAH
jgi:hypothetical protein